VILVILLAAMIGDLIWYEIGRRRGSSVLGFLCKVSLEPDVCVRKTEQTFERYGQSCLLFAKFVPGLYTVTPPLAGMLGIGLGRFVLLDGLGILAWTAVYVGIGYALTDQLEHLIGVFTSAGSTVGQLLLIVLVIYFVFKWAMRHLFLRRLRMARVSPAELKSFLDGGELPMIVDLRHSLDIENDPHVIPGAVVIPAERLPERHEEIPRDREIILYCT
jgi:membrane protein DedA with SNARE-associated domain